MGYQVEINMLGMGDHRVYDGSRLDIEIFVIRVALVRGEESDVMSLLHHQERDRWFVVDVQSLARVANGGYLVVHHLSELTFAGTISVEDDSHGFLSRPLFEHLQLRDHDVLQVGDDLSFGGLETQLHVVGECVGIVARGDLKRGYLLVKQLLQDSNYTRNYRCD